jgi:hypothetical protein
LNVALKRSLGVLAVLATAILVLYRKSVRLYWAYDDPWFLHVALMRRWTESFTHADIWRQNLFTPLLTSTYELFVATLWLEPRRWYIAYLVLLLALAYAVYAALRLYVDTVPAAAAALVFLIGPPLANVASNLGVIHYVEAMLFVVLSFIAFAKNRDVLSAMLYFVAILAKEIAVPLPGLLFLMECGGSAAAFKSGSRAAALQRVVPHAVALVVYTAWRLIVIGLPVTGYGWEVSPRDILTVPWKLVTLFGWPGAVLLAIMALVSARGLKTKRALFLAAAGLLLAIAPILPVSKEMTARYTLMSWLWLCAGFAIGLASMKRTPSSALRAPSPPQAGAKEVTARAFSPPRGEKVPKADEGWSGVVIGVTILIAVLANRQEWAREYTLTKRMSEEARVWVHERGDILLRNPAIPPGTMPELEWLKEDYFPHAKGSRWFYDDVYLCTHPVAGRRILEYNQRSRVVEEVQVDVDKICRSFRNDVPLTADFEHRGDALLWRFGPHADGTWRVILNEGEQAWDVPRESAYRLGTAKQLTLRIAYRSPAGWVTYSPPIALDFTRQSRTTWRR